MKIRSSLYFALSLVALSFLRDPDAAQQPSTTQPMTNIKVQAREVLLPVTVIDKKGALVTTLTAKDFTLTEDGVAQKIRYCELQTLPSEPLPIAPMPSNEENIKIYKRLAPGIVTPEVFERAFGVLADLSQEE